MIQANIFYSGRVQGVGFRYTVHRFARAQELDGWVRNLGDGRVEILVEGSQAAIEELCERIDQQFEGYVREKKMVLAQAKGTLGAFYVAY